MEFQTNIRKHLFQWSYGVLLWEIFTFCLHPYEGIDNKELKNYLNKGNRLDRSPKAPEFM